MPPAPKITDQVCNFFICRGKIKTDSGSMVCKRETGAGVFSIEEWRSKLVSKVTDFVDYIRFVK